MNKVISTKDFLVRLQAPRFLTQKDQSELVAFVHNDTGQPQTATVHLTADNLTQMLKTGNLDAKAGVPSFAGLPSLANLETGNWLSLRQAQALLSAPDPTPNRDRRV